MSKASVSVKFAMEVLVVLLRNIDWAGLDPKYLQKHVVENPARAGRLMTWVLRGCPKVDSIELEEEFDPEVFFEKDSDMLVYDSDNSPKTPAKLDFGKLRFVPIPPESRFDLEHLDSRRETTTSGGVFLGAKAFINCWHNSHLLPDEWKQRGPNGSPKKICFDGDHLNDVGGIGYVLSMWFDGKEWVCDTILVGVELEDTHVSAFLEA